MVDLDLIVTGKEIIGDMGSLNNFRLNSRVNPDTIAINALSFDYLKGEVKGIGGIFFKQGQIEAVNATIKGNFDQYDLSEFINENNKKKIQKTELLFSNLPPKLNVQVAILANQIIYKDQYLKGFRVNADISNNQIVVNRLKKFSKKTKTKLDDLLIFLFFRSEKSKSLDHCAFPPFTDSIRNPRWSSCSARA